MLASNDDALQVININEKYESIMSRVMRVQVDTLNTHTTQCTRANCYTNCHEKCSLDFLLDVEESGRCCLAFDSNKMCRECKHSYRDHRHFHSVGREIF